MGVKVQWNGLTEFLNEFRALPHEIQTDGMAIIRDETEAAAQDMAREYPKATGKLIRSIRTIYPASQLLIGIVNAKAPHSHIVDFGTGPRKTSSGANRGIMPAKTVAVPIARRHRSSMSRRIINLLRSKGFKIGNEP